MKKKYSRIRELWAVPKYKVLFKFGGWILFFLFILILAAVGNMMNNKSTKEDTSPKINFTKMKTNLIENNQSIKYTINDYYIEGDIIDNKLVGTLEYNDLIYKIKYDGDNLYQIKKDTETISLDLLTDINKDYLLPKNIIDKINNETNVIKSDDEKIYSYNISNVAYSFYLNDTYIEKVIILDNNITYNLIYTPITK